MQKTILTATRGWRMIDVKEFIQYKDLLYFLTIRSIKTKYAQSVLGVSWAIIQPLVTTIVFTIVFGRLAKVTTDGTPYIVFSFLALWPWNYFSGMLQESANSLVSNANLITKVYFPRVILPFAAVLSKLIDFAIAFVVVVVLLVYHKIHINYTVLFIPLLLLQLIMASIGIGLILSAMAIQYRDVKYALVFLVQLLMYAAPVVYSTNAVPENLQTYYAVNPMVGVIEGFRAGFTGKDMPWHWILPGMITSSILFVFGLFYFKKMEKNFADVA
ncbi:MAG TPA: phosphate ABC transporter permease [Chitinophagaceae bacterium]|nr:phosphate ABC transporter permease [Chitinophagaceae bacterium]